MRWLSPTWVVSASALIAFCASSARLEAQGGAGVGAQTPPPAPPTPTLPRRPAPAPARPTSWWCEVNAQPAAYARLAPEEAARNFFVSQVITRARRPGPEEGKAVERMCRTAFEVAYGSKWELVTARAQQAPTFQAAVTMRAEDMDFGLHRGHAQEFHLSTPE